MRMAKSTPPTYGLTMLDVTSGRRLFLKLEYNLAAFVVINIEDEIATETSGMTLDKGQT
jgi:hypothetical protein